MSTNGTTPPTQPLVRCAIYTRKSTDEGLEQDFNTLDAQREAAEAYIASQRAEGWLALPDRYDDGGYSGGSMDRPAVKRLLDDIEAGKVNCVVVYKVDRLSRSLLDFARMIEVFDRQTVSFVSVTQQFNTSTSMGRLILNVLLSFAQFEREIIGERIRDKIAAAKRKGKHCGGMPVLGYNVDPTTRQLVVNPEEAKLVVHIFERFARLGSGTVLGKELNTQGYRTKSWTTKTGKHHEGYSWNKGHLYRLLNNRKYIGKVEHKGNIYEGEHEAIVPQPLWDKVHAMLAVHARTRAQHTRAKTHALLRGIIRCGTCNYAMGISYTHGKRKQLYRYYVCVYAAKNSYHDCPLPSLAAGEVEGAVVEQLRTIFRTPEVITETLKATRRIEAQETAQLEGQQKEFEAKLRLLKGQAAELVRPGNTVGNGSIAAELGRINAEMEEAERGLAAVQANLAALREQAVTASDVAEALRCIDPVWDELFPAEQARVVKLLVERVIVHPNGLDVRIRTGGLQSLVSELRGVVDDAKTAPASSRQGLYVLDVPEGGSAERGGHKDGEPSIVRDGDNILIHIPMRFQKRSGRREIIVPHALDGTASKAPTDGKIIVALARARRWQELMESGEYASITDLADAVGMDRSYLRRLMTLNTLAPDIVESLLRGDEADGLSLDQFTASLPLLWRDQRGRFGCP